jgi:hypothetical protein
MNQLALRILYFEDLSVGVPEKVALEQLDRFAKEVIPAFKGAEARMGPLPTSDQRIPR